ncbi:MAG: hypothetical protein M3R04_02840, partial [bacterium]|nr:hypothetical protein [bacterium]
STGTGRVTCGFFLNSAVYVFSSTHDTLGAQCPPRADMSKGYVWPLYDYDIYRVVDYRATYGPGDGPHPDTLPNYRISKLVDSPGYDAEATIDWHNLDESSITGAHWMYFTSTRDNDIEIYRTRNDTGVVERLTDSFGYDGGPFISYDGSTVVFRRQVFENDAERAEFSELLAQKLVRPNRMELWTMNSDGTNQRQLTSAGGANFAPFLHPDNETVIFCSNMADPNGRTFELYTIPLAGGEIEQVTFGGEFDGFPMFSPDGGYIAWCSNRGGSRERETNVFVAEWVP